VIVYPSFRVYQLGSIRTDIREVLYWGFLLKSVEVIRLWLESEKMRAILYEFLLIYMTAWVNNVIIVTFF